MLPRSWDSLFCYDHFGGPGFILPDNLERHAWYNFSGRSEQKKLGAAELLLAIETGYDSARSSSAELKTRAEDLFSLDRLFRELLIFISKCSCAHDFRGRIASPPTYEEALISVTRCTDFITGYAPSLGTAELFYTSREGNDSSEALESIRLPYRYGTEIQIDIAHLIPDEKELIRFDPDDRGVLCQAKQCNKRLSPFNALLSEREGFDVFLTSDPMYFVSSKDPLFFSARPVSADEALSLAALTMDSLIHPQQPMVTAGRFSRLKGLLHKK